MQFYKDLYVSDSLENKKDKIIKEVKHKKIRPNIYVIALPHCDHNQLEFYSSSMIKQKIFDKDSLYIVGIAKGYDEAAYVVQDIYDDILKKTGNVDVRRFFEDCRQKGGK